MENKNQLINLPSAIVLSATIIAIAIIWTNNPTKTAGPSIPTNQQQEINMPPITAEDHIFGNPNATIKIVEYSDPACPFCKMFHSTMRQVMQQYGSDGDVAWVYRHFPLDIHPNAGKEAEAMECAASLGGNNKFWSFTNRLYDVTPSVTPNSPKGLDPKELPRIAKEIGLDVSTFNDCLASGKFKDKVNQQYLGGINAGVQATPYSIIITNKTSSKFPLIGAQPLSTIKTAIDTILSQK